MKKVLVFLVQESDNYDGQDNHSGVSYHFDCIKLSYTGKLSLKLIKDRLNKRGYIGAKITGITPIK